MLVRGMPPKTRYTREAVLDAALEVVRNEGLRGVSARTVARTLGASTAPVLATFESMQALTDAVVAALIEELLAAIDATEASDPMRAAAFAMARFTADHPHYYEALFLHAHPSPPDWVAIRSGFSGPLGASDRFRHLGRRQRDALAWRASVVAHGICIEIWSGRWTQTSDRAIWRLVDQLIEPIIGLFLAERSS
ncbi:MAG: TetR/AcrR family transcriptional regulator [Myxococcota bacterium]